MYNIITSAGFGWSYVGTVIGTESVIKLTFSTEWVDIYPMEEGNVIFEVGGPGKATIIEKPIYQNNYVICSIKYDQVFSKTTFVQGEWGISWGKFVDLRNLVPEFYFARPVMQVYKQLTEVLLNQFQESVRLLDCQNDRFKSMPEQLRAKIAQMGWEVDLLFNTPLATNVVSLLRQMLFILPDFYERNGSSLTLNFLRFITNSFYNYTPLWTKDYKDFVDESSIVPSEKDKYYLTSRIHLEYDSKLDIYNGNDLVSKYVYELVQYTLPVHICIHTLESISKMVTTLSVKALPPFTDFFETMRRAQMPA